MAAAAAELYTEQTAENICFEVRRAYARIAQALTRKLSRIGTHNKEKRVQIEAGIELANKIYKLSPIQLRQFINNDLSLTNSDGKGAAVHLNTHLEALKFLVGVITIPKTTISLTPGRHTLNELHASLSLEKLYVVITESSKKKLPTDIPMVPECRLANGRALSHDDLDRLAGLIELLSPSLSALIKLAKDEPSVLNSQIALYGEDGLHACARRADDHAIQLSSILNTDLKFSNGHVVPLAQVTNYLHALKPFVTECLEYIAPLLEYIESPKAEWAPAKMAFRIETSPETAAIILCKINRRLMEGNPATMGDLEVLLKALPKYTEDFKAIFNESRWLDYRIFLSMGDFKYLRTEAAAPPPKASASLAFGDLSEVTDAAKPSSPEPAP